MIARDTASDVESHQGRSAPEDQLLGVSIDVSALCNLRCTTCSLETSYPNKGLMSSATFERIVEALPRLQHLALSVNAEPMMHPRLVDMAARAKQVTAGRIVTSFTTNATLLDEKRAQALFETGLDALEVSLDGSTKETFESIRVRGEWELVRANLARLVPLRTRLGLSKPHLSIRFTLFEDNLGDIEGLLELAHRVGIMHVVVNGLEPYDETMARKVLYARNERRDTLELFEWLEARATQLGMRIDLPRTQPETIDDCRLIDHSLIVLWNGDVAPCSPLGYTREFFHFGERVVHEQKLFGNVHQRSLHEIWNDPDYVRWRAGLRAGEVYEACKTCLKRAGVVCPLKHWKWLETRQPIALESARQSNATPSSMS